MSYVGLTFDLKLVIYAELIIPTVFEKTVQVESWNDIMFELEVNEYTFKGLDEPWPYY